MSNINLKEKPFFLTEEQIAWVDEKKNAMSLEQKAGQLFCVLGDLYSEDELNSLVKNYGVGGVLFRPIPAEELKKRWKALDQAAVAPLLKAANLEEGGSGALSDGTHFAVPLQVAATNEPQMAEKFGKVCATEGIAGGINWTFSPVVDIDMNFRNPITNIRTYGSDKEKVFQFASEYVKAVQTCGMAAAAKHFPGDGVDFRDQHLYPTYNTLSAKEWYESYGAIYEGLINQGLLSVMVGHIVQPNVARDINPSLEEEEVLPASLSKEMLTGVLRKKYQFNGVITTDATIMGGYTMAMERKRAIPTTIAAGCDMIVFNTDFYEDYQYLLDGVREGIVSQERIDEAVTRILALKAKVACESPAIKEEIPTEAWVKECADKGITLVKNKENILPISVKRYPKIRLVFLGQEETEDGNIREMMTRELEKRGFEVELYRPFEDDLHGTKELSKDQLSLYVAHYPTASNQVTVRIFFCKKHALDLHRYPNEEPGIFVSFQNPYHLQDEPRMKTFINAYTPTQANVEAVVDKLLGISEFKGVSPVDAFCGMQDTRY